MKILLTLLLALATPAWASPLPEGCQSVAFKKYRTMIQMKADPTAIYVLYNRSGSSVILTRVGPKPGASAGWASEISSHQASVLHLDEPSFLMSCQQMQSDSNFQKVKCADVLSVCRYTEFKAKDESKAKGNFWLTENAKSEELVGKMIERGFVVN